MATELILNKIPYEASLVDRAGLVVDQIDIVGLTNHFAQQLRIKPEIVQVGLLGLCELDEYYEGGVPQDVRDAFFTFYLHRQNIPLDTIAGSIYGRYNRDEYAHISQVVVEISRETNSWVAQDRDRFMYITGNNLYGTTSEKQEVLRIYEEQMRNGVDIGSVQEHMNESRYRFADDDAQVVRSKLIVKAQMQPTADAKLTALAQLGLSDAGIFKRLALATGNFRHVDEGDFGTYALQIRTAMSMLADGEQEEVVKGATGLSDADFASLSLYLQTEKPQTADAVSQELVELAKTGVPVAEWYKRLRALNIKPADIRKSPVYAGIIEPYIVNRIRSGTKLKDINKEGIYPFHLNKALYRSQDEFRKKMYGDIVSSLQPDNANICEVYQQLRMLGYRLVDIFADEQVFVPLQSHILQLQQEGVTWENIERSTGVAGRALHMISRESIRTGKKESKQVGLGGLTPDQWDVLEDRVFDCIARGITNYDAIASELEIERWYAHKATVSLIKSKRIESRRGLESDKHIKLRQALQSCPSEDIDTLQELLTEVNENFARRNPDLFITLKELVESIGLTYFGRIPIYTDLANRSGFPYVKIEYPIRRKGKSSLMRKYFIPRQMVDSMTQYFNTHIS